MAATISWSLPDSADSVALTLLDPGTGRLVVHEAGATGRLLAEGAGLVSNPVSIRTLAAADTLVAAGTVVDIVTLAVDSVSDSLKVELADTIESASGGDSLTVPLPGRPVIYAITEPTTPGSVTLDSLHTVIMTDTVTTAAEHTGLRRVSNELRQRVDPERHSDDRRDVEHLAGGL